MSASSTISNLQQALNCTGKCDCCANLQTQINQLRAEIAKLKPVDEARIVANVKSIFDPQIAAVTAAIAAVDPRVREALERAFQASGKADNALNVANNARGAANVAQGTATNAKGTADVAVGQSAASQREAARAKAAADNAKAAADAARQTATTAQGTATNAKGVADVAKADAINAQLNATRAGADARSAKNIAEIAARESELYGGLAVQAKRRADVAVNVAENAADGVRTVTRQVGILEGSLDTVRGIAGKALDFASDNARKIGKVSADALEAIGLSRRLQSELIQQGLKLGSLALRVADIAGLIIEVLVSVGLAEALGARVDRMQEAVDAIGRDVSNILGNILPTIRGIAVRAGADASFAKNLAQSLTSRVDSALTQASMAFSEARVAAGNATQAILIGAAAQAGVGIAINLGTRGIASALNATQIANRAKATADTALRNANGWRSPVSSLQAQVNALKGLRGLPGRNGRDGRDGRDGKPGKDGRNGRNGERGLPGKDGFIYTIQIPGIPGRNGRDGRDGRNGLPGAQGIQGIRGIPGKNGQDGKFNMAELSGVQAQLTNIQRQNSVIINQQNTANTSFIAGLGDLALLKIINAKLGDQLVGGIGGKLERMAKWLHLDRLLNIMTTAATVHNAFMLSNDIGQTLLGIISNVLQLIGLKDDNGQPFDIGSVISSTIENFIKSIVGADNYQTITIVWAKANRIYQATTNVLNSFLSLSQLILQANELIAAYTGKIGNALKRGGVVLENAYGWMNPQPKFNRVSQFLENVQNAASTVQMVTQVPLDIANATTELANASTEFVNAVKEDDKPENKANNAPEPDVLKAQELLSKNNSQPTPFDFSDLFDGED